MAASGASRRPGTVGSSARTGPPQGSEELSRGTGVKAPTAPSGASTKASGTTRTPKAASARPAATPAAATTPPNPPGGTTGKPTSVMDGGTESDAIVNLQNAAPTVSRIHPLPGMLRSTGFALSGGGAKGSFEVGACKYLMQASGIRPDVITCTSVGAVNGMKLAEGEGPPFQFQGQTFHRGLDGLEQIWLTRLTSPSDMYSPSEALKALPIDYYTALPLEISQLANDLLGKALSQVAAASPYLILLGTIGLPFVNLGPVESELQQVVALLEGSSFYVLDPIANLYDDGSIDKILVAESGIELLFATVGLRSGDLCYVRLVGRDGHGNLVGDLVDRDSVAEPIPFPGAIGYPIDMKAGMLASAAAPLMFEPQRLLPDFPENLEIFTDGGVRELVPVQAAIDRGCKRVFALDCNAPYPAASSQAPHQAQAPNGMFGIALDVLAILLDEIDRENVVAPSPDVSLLWHVQPLFEVEGDLEIDTGAIRVNIDYGHLCAFDCVDGSVRSAARHAFLRSTGAQIAVARRDISDRERCLRWVVDLWTQIGKGQINKGTSTHDVVTTLDYHRFADGSDQDLDGRVANLTADLDFGAGFTPYWDYTNLVMVHYLDEVLSNKQPPAVDAGTAVGFLQEMKCRLQPLYETRTVVAGPRSIEPSPDDPTTPDQPWLRWERPDSQAFFGDVWPTGPTCDPTLDNETLYSAASVQVEAKGTSGWAVQSGPQGSRGYFSPIQLLVPQDKKLVHVTGEFGVKPWGSSWAASAGDTWQTGWQSNAWSPVDLGVQASSVSCCLLADSPVGSLAAVVRVASTDGTSDSLLELAYDGQAQTWSVLGPVSVSGQTISGVTGNPVLFQCSFAQQETLELLIPVNDTVQHLSRDLSGGGWVPRSAGVSFAPPSNPPPPQPTSKLGPVSAPVAQAPRSITCIQGNYGAPANLEAVVGLGPITGTGVDSLESWYYDSWREGWFRNGAIVPTDGPISGINGDAVLFQSKIGSRGDFELMVPSGDSIIHLFRDNDGARTWRRRGSGVVYAGGTLTGNGLHGPQVLEKATPVAISAWQGIDGVAGSPNLEAIIRLEPPALEQQSGQFFEALWFDPANSAWKSAGQVIVDGSPLTA